MRYEVHAGRKFTEEDIVMLVEQDMVGEDRPFMSVMLLSGGTLVVQLKRTLQGLTDEKRIEGILKQALYNMSGEMRIELR